MIAFIISLIISFGSASSDATTTKKVDATRTTTTTTSQATSFGGTSTWGNGTD